MANKKREDGVEFEKDLPPATVIDSSAGDRMQDPVKVTTSTRTRRPSLAMQEKQKEEAEAIEKLAEQVGQKLDELMVDVRTDNDVHLQEDKGYVEDEVEQLVKSTSRVERMYERYQDMWREFCLFHDIMDEKDDGMLKTFFMELKKKYAASTIWVIYSCVNAHFVEKYGIKLNTSSKSPPIMSAKKARYLPRTTCMVSSCTPAAAETQRTP